MNRKFKKGQYIKMGIPSRQIKLAKVIDVDYEKEHFTIQVLDVTSRPSIFRINSIHTMSIDRTYIPISKEKAMLELL
jgi:hypothetical protein